MKKTMRKVFFLFPRSHSNSFPVVNTSPKAVLNLENGSGLETGPTAYFNVLIFLGSLQLLIYFILLINKYHPVVCVIVTYNTHTHICVSVYKYKLMLDSKFYGLTNLEGTLVTIYIFSSLNNCCLFSLKHYRLTEDGGVTL